MGRRLTGAHDRLSLFIATFFRRGRRNLFDGTIVHTDDFRARETIEHGAHQRFLRHGFDPGRVPFAFLFGERRRTAFACQRHHPACARPVLELLREIARQCARCARTGAPTCPSRVRR